MKLTSAVTTIYDYSILPCSFGSGVFFLQNVKNSFAISYICALLIIKLNIMEKGDIFWATNKNDHPHPIVFLEQIDRVRFKGCILSTKCTNGNILMSEEHFKTHEEGGDKYTVVFKNSHIVPNNTFIKMEFWLRSHEPVGRLTDQGIDFIKEYVAVDPVLCPAPICRYLKK